MMNVHSEMVEQPLVELLRETSQAHFLHALTVQEALVVLRERRERLRCLLQLFGGHEQHTGSALTMDHFRLLLAAELAWIERAIAVLQGSGSNPEEGVGSAESRVPEKREASMWHIICLCLPAVTRSEQQRFFTLFKDVLHAYGREPGEMDLSLFFLYALSPEEALTVLEERLDLVVRSQELLVQRGKRASTSDDMQSLVADHMRTLLAAEHEWLRRAIAQFQH